MPGWPGGLTWLRSRAHVLRLFSFSRSRGRHLIGRCLPALLHNELRPQSPRQRVFPFLLPSVVPAYLSFAAQPKTRTREGAGRRRGCCSRSTGSGGGGPSSSGVPRWGATCRRHTWSGDVRPAEGLAPAPPHRDLGEAGLTHRPRLPPFLSSCPGPPSSPSPKQLDGAIPDLSWPHVYTSQRDLAFSRPSPHPFPLYFVCTYSVYYL